jgi:hypothetical protein
MQNLSDSPTADAVQTRPTAQTEPIAVEKQLWTTPELRFLDIAETEVGATPGSQEDTLKHPGS